jgi:hypothetical protein
MGSRPDEIRVLRLEPVAARPALIEAGRLLRHDALKTQFAGLGDHDRALGDQRFAEQDSAGASDEPLERLPTLFDRASPKVRSTRERAALSARMTLV